MQEILTTRYSLDELKASEKKVQQTMADIVWHTTLSIINNQLGDEGKELCAFTPLVAESLAWYFAQQAQLEAKYPRCKETAPLSRKLTDLKKKYDDFMSEMLDAAHINRIMDRRNEMLKKHYMNFLQLEMAIRNELMKVYADHINVRAKAYMSICMIDLLTLLNEDAKEMMREFTDDGYNPVNPLLKSLRPIMDGFVGEMTIQQDLNIKVGIRTILQKVKTIHY